MEYFKTEQLSEHIIRITDLTQTSCYLIQGSERACLIDTCWGYGDLASCVRSLTDKPVFVVLTHGHCDHIGGAGQFDTVYMNPKEAEVYQRHSTEKWRGMVVEQYPMFGEIPEELVIPYADSERFLDLRDGDVFDLGGITLQMIEVPGHTPGILCPLVKEERIIFFGDACGVGVLLFDEFSATVSEYRNSLLKLKAVENQYDTIYRNHGTFWSPKELLDNVIECCDLILSGTDAHEPVIENGFHLFSAQKLCDGKRADGKEGNIKYAQEKAV